MHCYLIELEASGAEEEENDVLSGYHKNFEIYKNKSKCIAKKGTSEREAQVSICLFYESLVCRF